MKRPSKAQMKIIAEYIREKQKLEDSYKVNFFAYSIICVVIILMVPTLIILSTITGEDLIKKWF